MEHYKQPLAIYLLFFILNANNLQFQTFTLIRLIYKYNNQMTFILYIWMFHKNLTFDKFDIQRLLGMPSKKNWSIW